MGEKIKIKSLVDRLQFRFPFHIAHGVRTGTDVVFIVVEVNGHFGIGEATLPPYLHDTIQTTLDFFNRPEVKNIEWPFHPRDVFYSIHQSVSEHMPAKAALDLALWRLYASITGKDIATELGIRQGTWEVPHCYTIDVSDTNTLREKYAFALEHGFTFFKLKLDGLCDERMIGDFREISQLPFAVDANQSWKDVKEGMAKATWLKSQGCVFIEQPFRKDDVRNTKVLMQESEMFIMADEALQLASDFPRIAESFNAINLKLQKCGGLSPAVSLLQQAAHANVPVMVGCMSESSIGCDAGELIAKACKWADLDGPYLIKNDEELSGKLKAMINQWS
ncbi:MAG: hypothetical protein K1X54_02305 [Flavobacteriales bacterium]|nr:hypothetical protein [Flavobacteriales bacterium]